MSTATTQVSLRGLRTFCVAAEYESFRAAADDLYITASAVSHQIKNLEQELGLPLFYRKKRRLQLTETGRSLYEDIAPLVNRLNDVTSQYRADAPRRVLRLSISTFFASELFLPRLHEFTLMHGDVDLQVDTIDYQSATHPRSADVSIRLLTETPQTLASDVLFPLRLVPAGSPAFKRKLAMEGNRISSNFPIIVHNSRPTAWRQWSAISGIELPRRCARIQLDSMIAITRAAEHGIGAALVPVPLGNAWFENGSLEPLFDQDLLTSEYFMLVYRGADAEQDGVRVIREWVLQNFVSPT